jgi:hypothetical protein
MVFGLQESRAYVRETRRGRTGGGEDVAITMMCVANHQLVRITTNRIYPDALCGSELAEIEETLIQLAAVLHPYLENACESSFEWIIISLKISSNGLKLALVALESKKIEKASNLRAGLLATACSKSRQASLSFATDLM